MRQTIRISKTELMGIIAEALGVGDGQSLEILGFTGILGNGQELKVRIETRPTIAPQIQQPNPGYLRNKMATFNSNINPPQPLCEPPKPEPKEIIKYKVKRVRD